MQCQKSILMIQYEFLASSCDCANINSVKLETLPSANGNFTMYRPPDKSVYWKIIFFISHPKHMLLVLKRTVSTHV